MNTFIYNPSIKCITNSMKVFLIQKYQSAKQKLSKQTILNFVGAHPRLTAVLAGLGISITFASIGRFAVHEAFAITASSPTSDLVYNVPNDHITNVEIDKVPGPHTHQVVAFTCPECAKEFAPGQEAVAPGDAQNVAPGQEAKSPGDASNFAPGELKKKGS
jgi:hypothetical protein